MQSHAVSAGEISQSARQTAEFMANHFTPILAIHSLAIGFALWLQMLAKVRRRFVH